MAEQSADRPCLATRCVSARWSGDMAGRISPCLRGSEVPEAHPATRATLPGDKRIDGRTAREGRTPCPRLLRARPPGLASSPTTSAAPGSHRVRRAARRHQPGHRRDPGPGAAVGAADLDAAVGRPRRAPGLARAVDDRAGRGCSPSARGLDARREDSPARSPREMGKTLADARAEVGAHDRDGRGGLRDPDDDAGPRARGRRHAASTPRRSASRSASAPRSCPFNFPAMVPFWFLPFAIACGNTFVLKPSEQVPLTQELVFEVLDELGAAARRRQPRQRRPRGRRGHPRPPRHRRDLVRRLGAGRAATSTSARRQGRQARAGARRRQEPHGRHARRRDRQDRRRDHRLRVRRRRPALHGRLGRRHRRRRHERAAADALERRDRGAARRRRPRRGRPTSARSSRAPPRDRIVGWIERGVERRRRRSSSTAASPDARPGRRLRRPDDPRRRRRPTWTSRARRSSARCCRSSRPSTLDEAIEIVNAQPLRQRHLDLHRVGRRRPQATATTSRSG